MIFVFYLKKRFQYSTFVIINSNDMIKPFSDEYFMGKALDEAKKAFEEGEIPVGCVVVSNNTIIARAHNLTEKLTDVTAHAEMQAITAASNLLGGKYLTGCKIYVTLEPCVMCAGALSWAQVDEIIYGVSDPKRGYTIFAPDVIHSKSKVKKGVLENETARLMTDFFSTKR
jgi:tRNA(adenine34) deaminase